jgi:hypothetical protein
MGLSRKNFWRPWSGCFVRINDEVRMTNDEFGFHLQVFGMNNDLNKLIS